jgi:hypothetical protein
VKLLEIVGLADLEEDVGEGKMQIPAKQVGGSPPLRPTQRFSHAPQLRGSFKISKHVSPSPQAMNPAEHKDRGVNVLKVEAELFVLLGQVTVGGRAVT